MKWNLADGRSISMRKWKPRYYFLYNLILQNWWSLCFIQKTYRTSLNRCFWVCINSRFLITIQASIKICCMFSKQRSLEHRERDRLRLCGNNDSICTHTTHESIVLLGISDLCFVSRFIISKFCLKSLPKFFSKVINAFLNSYLG